MVTSDGAQESSAPSAFALHQNYPNPFNLTTTIRYDMPTGANVRFTLFDLLGRHTATLVDDNMPAGRHTVRFDRSGLASGVYMYRLPIGDLVQTKRLLLLK